MTGLPAPSPGPRAAQGQPEAVRYRLFGLTVRTRQRLPGLPVVDDTDDRGRAVRSDDRGDHIEYVVADHPPPPIAPGDPVYRYDTGAPDDAPTVVWRQGDQSRVAFGAVAVFDLTPAGIVCYPEPGVAREAVTNLLLSSVMALWLALRGVLIVHASAVVIGGRGAAFVADSHGGKSTLAVALLHTGCPLLSDDMVPIERTAQGLVFRPGYAAVRLWPELALYLRGRYDDLPPVHPAIDKRWVTIGPSGVGAMADAPAPPGVVYLVQRRDAADPDLAVTIEDVRPVQATFELLRHAWVPRVTAALGMQGERLALVADLVTRVPCRHLVFPSGLEHLPRVAEAVVRDAEGA